jgi:hypothetical protein
MGALFRWLAASRIRSNKVRECQLAQALTLDAHMEKLRELRDDAKQRGQLSAAIQAEVKRGELRRFYVKQIESGEAGEFERMTDDELREFIAGQDKILASLKH